MNSCFYQEPKQSVHVGNALCCQHQWPGGLWDRRWTQLTLTAQLHLTPPCTPAAHRKRKLSGNTSSPSPFLQHLWSPGCEHYCSFPLYPESGLLEAIDARAFQTLPSPHGLGTPHAWPVTSRHPSALISYLVQNQPTSTRTGIHSSSRGFLKIYLQLKNNVRALLKKHLKN